MNENTSLFSHADLQIQLHPPALAAPQEAAALALHEPALGYRTKPIRRRSPLAKKGKSTAA